MRLESMSKSEYARRIERVQEELKKEDIDVLVGYSSECESGTSRYLTGFWPFFDFASVIVPAQGNAVLVTGGPESLELAKHSSGIPEICINTACHVLQADTVTKKIPGIPGKLYSLHPDHGNVTHVPSLRKYWFRKHRYRKN